MSETKWKYHVKNPANQPFVGAGRKNLTKKNSWWNASSGTFWRNRSKPKAKKAADE